MLVKVVGGVGAAMSDVVRIGCPQPASGVDVI